MLNINIKKFSLIIASILIGFSFSIERIYPNDSGDIDSFSSYWDPEPINPTPKTSICIATYAGTLEQFQQAIQMTKSTKPIEIENTKIKVWIYRSDRIGTLIENEFPGFKDLNVEIFEITPPAYTELFYDCRWLTALASAEKKVETDGEFLIWVTPDFEFTTLPQLDTLKTETIIAFKSSSLCHKRWTFPTKNERAFVFNRLAVTHQDFLPKESAIANYGELSEIIQCIPQLPMIILRPGSKIFRISQKYLDEMSEHGEILRRMWNDWELRRKVVQLVIAGTILIEQSPDQMELIPLNSISDNP